MSKEKIIEHGNDDKRVISDKPTRSGYEAVGCQNKGPWARA